MSLEKKVECFENKMRKKSQLEVWYRVTNIETEFFMISTN